MKNLIIETEKGKGEILNLHLSELGFLMVRVSYENGTFVNYNLGIYDEKNNIFSDQIKKLNKL